MNNWNKFDINNPPKDVVLCAIDTYDCGWCIDTAWWSDQRKCWMITGTVSSTKAHLKYTHWMELPDAPNVFKDGVSVMELISCYKEILDKLNSIEWTIKLEKKPSKFQQFITKLLFNFKIIKK